MTSAATARRCLTLLSGRRHRVHGGIGDRLASEIEARTGKGSGSAGRPSKRFVAIGSALAPELPVRRDDLVLSLLGRALELAKTPAEAAQIQLRLEEIRDE